MPKNSTKRSRAVHTADLDDVSECFALPACVFEHILGLLPASDIARLQVVTRRADLELLMELLRNTGRVTRAAASPTCRSLHDLHVRECAFCREIFAGADWTDGQPGRGWETIGEVEARGAGGARCLAAAGELARARLIFPERMRPQFVTFKCKTNRAVDGLGACFALNGMGRVKGKCSGHERRTGVFLTFARGHIWLHGEPRDYFALCDGSDEHIIQKNYAHGQWYTVKLGFHWLRNRVCAWIDGVPCEKAGTRRGVGSRKRQCEVAGFACPFRFTDSNIDCFTEIELLNEIRTGSGSRSNFKQPDAWPEEERGGREEAGGHAEDAEAQADTALVGGRTLRASGPQAKFEACWADFSFCY